MNEVNNIDEDQDHNDLPGVPKMPDIKFIKLITGENLITMVAAEEDDPYVTVFEPLAIQLHMGPSGQMLAATMDWLPKQIVANSTATIMKQDIIAIADVSADYKLFYSRLQLARLQEEDAKEQMHTRSVDTANVSVGSNTANDANTPIIIDHAARMKMH